MCGRSWVRVDSMYGRRSSITSGWRGGARGESSVEISCCRSRVWWVRWVARDECAVVNLSAMLVFCYPSFQIEEKRRTE
jgi:hypothetical protein